jgi:signal peptidase II
VKLKDIAPRYWIWFGVTLVFTILDQWTKAWILAKEAEVKTANPSEELRISVIDGFFELVHTENPGAAFGMFAEEGDANNRMIFFTVFTVIAVGFLIHMLWQLPRGDRFQTSAIGLITSGAIGNFIDRSSLWFEGIFPGGMNKQSVTDFLRVFTDNETAVRLLGKWFGRRSVRGGPVEWVEWPAFNVADAAICIGLGMFFFHYLFLEKDDENVDDMTPVEPIVDDEESA